MPRKRYSPETLLQDVIAVLETDDGALTGAPLAPHVLGAYRGVLVKLLTHGPLSWRSGGIWDTRATSEEDQILRARAVLLQLLRSAVRGADRERPSSGISTHRPVTFEVQVVQNEAQITASGDTNDVLTLQLLMLLHDVGLRNIRTCACGRLFVKTYRRAFCSTTCQKRYYMRTRRENERRQRERRRARRRKERV